MTMKKQNVFKAIMVSFIILSALFTLFVYELLGPTLIALIARTELIKVGFSNDYVFNNVYICNYADMNVPEAFYMTPPKKTKLTKEKIYCITDQIKRSGVFIGQECADSEPHIKEFEGLGKEIPCEESLTKNTCKAGQQLKEYYINSTRIFYHEQIRVIQCE